MVPSAQVKHSVNRCVVFAELGEEAVLLNAETGIYFGLDAVGTRIWTLLGDGLDDEQISSRLHDEYEVDATVLRADVGRLIDQLEAHGLISRSAAVSL